MKDMVSTDWNQAAKALHFRSGAFIDGDFVAAQSGRTFESVSPIDGRHLANIACCGAADVDHAVAVARRAFEDGRWSRRAPAERKQVLRRYAELIRAHGDELALLETLDMGKPISDSLSIDLRATANCFDWYGEAIDKIYDEIAPTAQGTLAMITREPGKDHKDLPLGRKNIV